MADKVMRGEFSHKHSPPPISTSPLQQRRLFQASINHQYSKLFETADHFCRFHDSLDELFHSATTAAT